MLVGRASSAQVLRPNLATQRNITVKHRNETVQRTSMERTRVTRRIQGWLS
jgi:hypothetical protein